MQTLDVESSRQTPEPACREQIIAAELVRDTSATGQEGAARCRAALPDPEAKEAAWTALFDSDLSNYLIAATAQGFWQPEQDALLGDRPQRYFEAVVDTAQRRGPAVGRLLARYAFPAYDATEETVAVLSPVKRTRSARETVPRPSLMC